MRLGNTVYLVRQIGNIIETSFPSFRKHSLLYAIRGGRNRLCYAERESGTPIRYVRETRRWGNIVERLLEKGLEPLERKRTLERSGICIYGYT